MIPVNYDGFMASIQASESIADGFTVLHGPGACRAMNSTMAEHLIRRDYVPREGPFYYGNCRVPCTYLDTNDYINGSEYKLTELLATVGDVRLVTVIQTPGTSLIGDDLTGALARSDYKGPKVVQRVCQMSMPASAGYDVTLSEIIRAVCARREKVKGTVNVMGLPILMNGWEETKRELTGYLESMGLRVTAWIGAGCTYDELLRCPSAEFNISVLPEFCRHTAETLESLGVPTLFAPVPFGFRGTDDWIRSVAERAGTSPDTALECTAERRVRSTRIMMSFTHGASLTRGKTYSVSLDSEIVLPLVKWMHSYLSMFPRCIRRCGWWSPEFTEELESFLESIHCGNALSDELTDERCDLLFSDGMTAGIYEKSGRCRAGIEMQLPYLKRYGFVERPILGTGGTEQVLDAVFNGLFTPRLR